MFFINNAQKKCLAARLCPDLLGELQHSPRLPIHNRGRRGGEKEKEKGGEGRGEGKGKEWREIVKGTSYYSI